MGRLQGREAGRGPASWGTIAQSFAFCNGGVAGASDSGVRPLMGTWVLSWPAPSFDGGSSLAGAVVPPAHPPTFLGTGGLPLYPRRGLRPLHPAWGRDGRGAYGADAAIPPALPWDVFQNRGTHCSPGGGCAPCAFLQRRVWFGLRRCPTCPPSNVFRNRGTPPVPPAGAAPPAPRLGNGGVGGCLPGASGRFLACARALGKGVGDATRGGVAPKVLPESK